ncbi:MAG: hypothetical protein EOO24_58620 [Comamonadaceae bacterium]|nr:MAG: hypothetical protein EOO24_58620 [Comamonadaceae bacterium]
MAEAYVTDITRVVGEWRRLRPHLRVIVDRSTAPIYAAGVPELLLKSYHTILRAGDRIAMVVESSLAKGQVRKVAGREETQSFLSISAARTWVLAYD